MCAGKGGYLSLAPVLLQEHLVSYASHPLNTAERSREGVGFAVGKVLPGNLNRKQNCLTNGQVPLAPPSLFHTPQPLRTPLITKCTQTPLATRINFKGGGRVIPLYSCCIILSNSQGTGVV